MKYLKNINIEIDKELYTPITTKQGDTSRYLLFKILNNGVPFSLSNKTVRAYLHKPDGTNVFNDLKIINIDGGLVELKITTQMSAANGVAKGELKIYEGTDILTTMDFTLDIVKSNADNAVESSNEFSALTLGLNKIDEWDKYFTETSGKIEEKYTKRLTDLEYPSSPNNLINNGSFENGTLEYWNFYEWKNTGNCTLGWNWGADFILGNYTPFIKSTVIGNCGGVFGTNIPIKLKPNKKYTLSYYRQTYRCKVTHEHSFLDSSGNVIGSIIGMCDSISDEAGRVTKSNSSEDNTGDEPNLKFKKITVKFTTPANCTQMYFANSLFYSYGNAFYFLDNVMLNDGCVEYSFNPSFIDLNKAPMFTFQNALRKWYFGDKFPIAFYGDSTTEDAVTTGVTHNYNTLGTDFTPTTAYPYKLEQILRDYTKSGVLRIYNAGFSGKNLQWGIDNFDLEFGKNSAYNDVKMIGIGFGINDRLSFTSIADYTTCIYNKTKELILKCYSYGIQPFLLTNQATLETNVATDMTQYPCRSSFYMNIANDQKRRLSKEFNLELIDLNAATENYLINSTRYQSNEICTDRLHFSEIGHEFEAGFIAKHFIPTVIDGKNKTSIGYGNNNIRYAPPENRQISGDRGDRFVNYFNYDRGNSTDTKIMEVLVWIDKPNLSLKSYKASILSDTYISVDGHNRKISYWDGFSSDILGNFGLIDIGLHKFSVFTGTNSTTDFKGFYLEETKPCTFVNYANCGVEKYNELIKISKTTDVKFAPTFLKDSENNDILEYTFDTRVLTGQDNKSIWIIIGGENDDFTAVCFANNMNNGNSVFSNIRSNGNNVKFPQDVTSFNARGHMRVIIQSDRAIFRSLDTGLEVELYKSDFPYNCGFITRPRLGITIENIYMPFNVKIRK